MIAWLFSIAMVMQTIGSNATLAYAASIATGRLEIGDQVGLSGGVATFANGTTIKIYTGASADTANTEITMDRENGDNHTVETNEFDDALFVKVVVDVPFGEGVSTPSINWAGSAEVWDVTPDESISGIYKYTKQIDFSHNSICRINISFESQGGAGSGGTGGESQDVAWFDQPNKYLASGINIMSHYVGDEEGTITYEFSDDMTNWSDVQTLNKAQIDSAINTLSQEDPDSTDLARAKEKLIGIGSGYPKKYVRIKVEGDLSGDHLGAEVFTKNAQGTYSRNDGKTPKFWSYEKQEWVSFNGPDRSYEEYLKQVQISDHSEERYAGMIIDLSELDAEADALKVILPFDSRKSVGWWNGSYKEKVIAAEEGNEGFVPENIDWLYNGNAYLVNVKGSDGKIYYSEDPDWTPDPDLKENYQVVVGKPGFDRGLRPGYSGPKGSFTAEEMEDAAYNAGINCMIPKGATVTVKMVPDAGYQLLRAEINDSPIVPDNGTTSQFSFEVKNNMGITGIFEKTPDIVDVSEAEKVSEIEIENSEAAIDSGNLAVTVSDDEAFDTSSATAVIEGTPITAVDIRVDNVVAKGGELSEEEQNQAKNGTLMVKDEKFWTENMSELDNPIDITMTLDNVTVGEGESIAIVREHNGVCEKIHATVKTDGGKTLVTFASNKFSTYTIIKTGAETGGRPGSSSGSTATVIPTPTPAPTVGTVVSDTNTGAKVEISDVASKEVTYTAPISADKKLTVPAVVVIGGAEYKVTKIGDNAFQGCANLKSVTLPKDVVEIGAGAFKGCTSLTKVTLPNKVTKIGANAFNGCKKLKTITIKSTKLTDKNIDKRAFKGIKKGTVIKVPKKKVKAYTKLFQKKGLSKSVKVKA